MLCKHVEIQVKNDSTNNQALSLKINGRFTEVNGEILDKRTSDLKFEESYHKDILLKLGKGGVNVEIKNLRVFLKLPKNLSFSLSYLHKVGINYSYESTSTTTHLILPHEQEVDSNSNIMIIDSLIRQIPIVSPEFVEEFVGKREIFKTEFLSNFPDFRKFLVQESYLPDIKRTFLFEGVCILITNEIFFELLKSPLHYSKSNVNFYNVDQSTKLQDLILHSNKLMSKYGKLLILQYGVVNLSKSEVLQNEDYKYSLLLNELSKKLEVSLISTTDLLNAIVEKDISPLFKKRPGATGNGRKKRQKIHALDSLDFFAGGEGSLKKPKSSNIELLDSNRKQENEESSQIVPPNHPTPPSLESPGKDVSAALESQPKRKRQRAKILALPNEMLMNNSSPRAENLEEATALKSIKNTVVAGISESTDNGGNDDAEEINTGSHEASSEVTCEQSSQINSEKKPKKTESQSFSTAILKAKDLANERIKNELGIKQEGEEIDISENLKNLAIIETFVVPESQLSSANINAGTQSSNEQWKGRKNFKTFTKKLPKWRLKQMGLESQDDMSSINHPQNSIFLATREYVGLSDYSGTLISNRMISKEDEEIIRNMEKLPQESYNHGESKTNAAKRIPRQHNVAENANPLFVENSDSEEESGFQFSKISNNNIIHNDDGLGMNVRVERTGIIPEYRKGSTTLNKNSNTWSSSATNSLNRSMIDPVRARYNDNYDAYDDNDDESDDGSGAKFRFTN
ncbi:hypothetical protein WICMUC_004599 [Wickerhamomyces mucosus]|uniref:Uncharacterized protein n=1 Tax=Wickerhamomyces mucosus TaxID=1378264 RepID=A0A9P8PGK6_9ASCO|nr:hypothetical protein WICMUC_004599 [Wickerhamomyces mucosus]